VKRENSENTAVQPVLVTSVSTKQPQTSCPAYPADDLGKDEPTQPCLNVYPARLIGKRPGRFQASWYVK